MKTNLVYPILTLAAALTGNCLAAPPALDPKNPILEEFSSPDLNVSRFYQYNVGNAKLVNALVQVGTKAKPKEEPKLNLTVLPDFTNDDFVSAELLTGYPGYFQNWEMTIDLTNSSGAGKDVGCGFMIFNEADRRDFLFVEFYGIAGVKAGVLVNGKDAAVGKLSAKYIFPKGSIRVRFNAVSKLMTFSASIKDKSEGYKWYKIGTFSPTGQGGVVRANWKMKPTGQFGIQLFGFGHKKMVDLEKVTLDNFAVKALR